MDDAMFMDDAKYLEAEQAWWLRGMATMATMT